MAGEDLLPRVAAGDAPAVEQCLDRYGGLIWSIALRFSASRADAEDAVQEVFIDLWKSAARFDRVRAAEATFVAMIARRRLIDRKRASDRGPKSAPEAALELLSNRDDLQMENVSDARVASKVIQELPEERRRVL